jgi:CRISPR-associated protein Cmr2
VDEAAVERVILDIISSTSDEPRKKFLALWRLLPERVTQQHPWLEFAPADTRIPDHTIWHHLDITAGLAAAEEGARGPALLSFALGPVQSFIATARTVRDLWTGSMILAYLTFSGMKPVLERLGPTALVYPSLRGIPFLDRWLQEPEQLGSAFAELTPTSDLSRAPCLPNRFVAVVPWGQDGILARSLANDCQARAKQAWDGLAERVRRILAKNLADWPLAEGWDRRWHEQIGSFFDFRTSILKLGGTQEEVDQRLAQLLADKATFSDGFASAAQIRSLAQAIRRAGHAPGYEQEHAGRWQYQMELCARIMESQRSVRHVPVYHAESPAPPKCSLMGTYEQMGPDKLEHSRRFWVGDPDQGIPGADKRLKMDGIRLRSGERLCAVALVKRFAAAAGFAQELGLSRDDLYFEDVASVAAAVWLKQENRSQLLNFAKDQGSSSWLHWQRPDMGKDDHDDAVPPDIWRQLQAARAKERPPSYYAVLMMDGDNMGDWLRGDKSPPVRDVLHSDAMHYFERLGPSVQDALNAPRPVGPALHAAISQALANFALHFVPHLVMKHSGKLIYAGGDDVLALLPTSSALECARELNETFRRDWALNPEGSGREFLLMGREATVSAGIAIVHYKEDLRFALHTARAAEKDAKNAGRDILQVKVCRRSGEHSSALCPWEEVASVGRWVNAFQEGASDRWAYHLSAEEPTLRGLEVEAMLAEIRRQLKRAEPQTQDAFARDVPDAFQRYLATNSKKQRFKDSAEAFKSFIKLCQTASFLARGRDQ